MSEQPTPEQKLPEWPTEPQRLTAGRYGNVQWGYAEYVGDYDYIGRKYEFDRANAAIARLRVAVAALYQIAHGSVQEDEAIAYAAAKLVDLGEVPE